MNLEKRIAYSIRAVNQTVGESPATATALWGKDCASTRECGFNFARDDAALPVRKGNEALTTERACACPPNSNYVLQTCIG